MIRARSAIDFVQKMIQKATGFRSTPNWRAGFGTQLEELMLAWG